MLVIINILVAVAFIGGTLLTAIISTDSLVTIVYAFALTLLAVIATVAATYINTEMIANLMFGGAATLALCIISIAVGNLWLEMFYAC